MKRRTVEDQFVSLRTFPRKRPFLLWRCFSLCEPRKLLL